MNTVLEVIIDYSNSMGPWNDGNKSYLLSDGNTRMSLAKKVLIDDIIPALDYTGNIRITSFYSLTENVTKKPVINLIYSGPFLKSEVLTKIQNLADPVNTGGTPISAALQASINYIKDVKGYDRKIILVTDGEETDGGDFRITAENGLKVHGIDYNIFIIGIGQNAVTAEKCRNLSNATKGGYVNLETKSYNKADLSEALRALTFKAVNSSISNVQNSNVRAITALQDKQISPKSNDINNQVVNQEMLNLLKGHTEAIELLNRQITNLEKSISSNSIKTDQCLGKINSIDLDGRIADLKLSFLNEFLEHIKSNKVTILETTQKLENIKSDFDELHKRVIDKSKFDELELFLSTQLFAMKTTIDKCIDEVKSYSNHFSNIQNIETKLDKIQTRIDDLHSEQLKMKEMITSVQSSINTASIKQKKSNQKHNILLGVLALALLAFMKIVSYKLNLFN